MFITHNLGVVALIADRVAVMYAGRIVECGPTEEIFADPRHPYTRALLAAVPSIDPDLPLPLPPSGESCDTGDLPPGCHFHPRCPECFAPCSSLRPELSRWRSGHAVACHLATEGEEFAGTALR